MSLDEMRNHLLKLINKQRKVYGVPPVVLDEKLNLLAQNHATDMGVYNYAQHVNLQGENSAARAKKMNIYSPIGENIAVNEDIEYAQFRLDRSPAHLLTTVV